MRNKTAQVRYRQSSLPMLFSLACLVHCGDDDAQATGTGDEHHTGTGSDSTSATGTSAAGDSTGGSEATTGGESGGTDTGIPLVCPGPDLHELNNELSQASPLALIEGKASTFAGVSYSDEDYFRFTSTLTDPIAISGHYAVAIGDTTDLKMIVRAADGRELARDASPRTSVTEDMLVHVRPKQTDSEFFVQISSNEDTCTPYEIKVDTLACYDSYEDNDELTQASQLELAPGLNQVAGPLYVTYSDEDFFSFTLNQTEPTHVRLSYGVQAGDETDLGLIIRDANGREVVRSVTPRSEFNEVEAVEFRPDTGGGLFFAQVRSNADTCQAYHLEIDTQACTDSFEDNDAFANQVGLPAGQQLAKINYSDYDWYQITSPAETGSCSIQYTVAPGSTQDLTLILHTANGSELTRDATPRSAAQETATVTWTADPDRRPSTLQVRASEDDCVDYIIWCE